MRYMELIRNRISELKPIAKDLHSKYQKYLPAFFFSFGFLLDIFTLGEVDDLSNILILGFYLLSSLCILSLELIEAHEKDYKKSWLNRFFKYRDDIFHFLCGSLLSAFTLFYFKSGSVANSFIFMTFMMTILLLNEVQLFQKQGIIIRSSMLMLCLISYLTCIVPILVGTTGPFIFYMCIIIALLLSISGYFTLTYINKNQTKNLKTLLIPQLAVGFIFLSLYAFKLIPPIPLSLKYIGVFHSVERVDGNYRTSDLTPWWEVWNNGDQLFKARNGDKIFLFTNIFAPGGFAGKIYIHWLKETKDGYKTSDRIPLDITGGREEGFRGFAYKSNFVPGDWQVRVESASGLEIGRINLEIVEDKSSDQRSFKQVIR